MARSWLTGGMTQEHIDNFVLIMINESYDRTHPANKFMQNVHFNYQYYFGCDLNRDVLEALKQGDMKSAAFRQFFGFLGYNYRAPPTFEEDSGDYEDDYFDTPKDNFFPVPNKYRLGPKRLLKLQQNVRSSIASRHYYDNIGDYVLKRAGLLPTVTTAPRATNPIIITDDDDNISDADIDFQID